VTIKGGRLAHNRLAADGIYVRYRKRGPLNIEGVDFASGTHKPGLRIVAEHDAGTVLNCIGNVFPNATPFSGARTVLNAIGNVYIESEGRVQHMPNKLATVDSK